jgi:carboxypeptidase family protein
MREVNGACGRALRCSVIALGVLVASSASAQQTVPVPTRHEIVRGTVTRADGAPVAGADVIATRAPDRVYKSTKSDSAGHYFIDWPDGTGDYLVHVAAIGFDAFRKRVTSTGDTVLVVDAKLTSQNAVQALAPVVTTAARSKPTRDQLPLGDPGTSEQTTSGMNGTLPPGLAGDLSAIAGTMPGVLTTPQGPSVLGLSSSQNSTTLNGMSFVGADIPRDANTRVRVASTAYDPARGWFSGANTNVELGPGGIFSSERSHVTLDAPALQYTDPTAAKIGQRYTNGQVSIGGDGELIPDAWYYNYGLQGGRRSADPVSLFTAGSDLLRQAGVASDSVQRLGALMRTAGIPQSAGGIGGAATTDNLSFIGRLDHKPYDALSFGAAKSTWGVSGYAKWSDAARLTATPVSTLGHEGKATQAIGMAQADYSTYFGNDYLAFVRSGLTYGRNRSAAYLALPDARVLVQSDPSPGSGQVLGSGDGGVASLSFGGASGFGNDVTQKTWESTADVQFFAEGTPRHRVKLNGDVRLDLFAQDIAANRLGTFGYNSLAEVAANTPSSFSRTLNNPARSGGEWNAFLAASDLFRLSPSWQFMYGARVEGNEFTAAPAYNPQVDQSFGVRTDATPNSMHVSPRVGFTYNRSGQIRNAQIGNGVGLFSFGAPGVLRGGFGEFRSLTPPPLLSGPMAATGLANSLTRVSCIGSAVPTPDWNAFLLSSSSIPVACASSGAGNLSDIAPTIQLIDPRYGPPRSWRGNLSWYSSWHDLNYTLGGLYSLNLNQPALTDLNFAGAPRFTLADESRPVYVAPSDIVAGSGLVASSGSRSLSQFGHVMENRGDGKSVSKQATLTISPDLTTGSFGRSAFFLVGYTLSSVQALARGFDGTTFGDPRQQAWMRGDLDARHQFIVQAANAFGPVRATLIGHLQSGLPFTPIVGSDINGDGLANDRAFVPDPSSVADTAEQRGLRALLASAQSSVSRCLSRQLGTAARANGCEGPWSASMNAQVSIAGDDRFMSRRVTINFGLVNVLGGIDQLVHGSAGLRGWGAMPMPDPVLFTVTGFDAAANRFRYAVNPRFGDTRPAATTIRAPFQLTLDVSIDIGRSLESQQVARFLAPGRTRRGDRATPGELKRRFERNIPDLYRFILQQSDSLLLTREQVDALTRAAADYKARMDTLWLDLSTYLAALPTQFDSRDAAKRLDSAVDRGWTMTRDNLQVNLKAILSPVQMTLLPGVVKGLVESSGPVRIRLFISG